MHARACYLMNAVKVSLITFADLSTDKEELYNVAAHLPALCQRLDRLLRSIVDYPTISQAVHHYNKKQFSDWKSSLGDRYSNVIANLRWHVDWQQNPKHFEAAIDEWLSGSR